MAGVEGDRWRAIGVEVSEISSPVKALLHRKKDLNFILQVMENPWRILKEKGMI